MFARRRLAHVFTQVAVPACSGSPTASRFPFKQKPRFREDKLSSGVDMTIATGHVKLLRKGVIVEVVKVLITTSYPVH